MRTTVDLPNSLFRLAKAAASLRGVSLKQWITGAVERELASTRVSHQAPKRVKLPLVRSKTPGTKELTNEQIAGYLEQDRRVFTRR